MPNRMILPVFQKFITNGLTFNDLRVPLASARPGASSPTFAKVVDDGAGSIGVFAWSFANNLDQTLHFTAELPHTYGLALEVHPHIHWLVPDGNAGDIVFEFECTTANVDGTFPNTTVETLDGVDVTAAPEVALKHVMTDFSEFTTTGWEPSRLLLCRISRLGSSGDDDYGSVVFITQMDFHIQMDSLGTRTEVHTSK